MLPFEKQITVMWILVVALLPLLLAADTNSCKKEQRIPSLRNFKGCEDGGLKYNHFFGSTRLDPLKIWSENITRVPHSGNRTTYIFRLEQRLAVGHSINFDFLCLERYEINLIVGKPVINKDTHAAGSPVIDEAKSVVALQILVVPDPEHHLVTLRALSNGRWSNVKEIDVPFHCSSQYLPVQIRVLENKYEIMYDFVKIADFYHVIPFGGVTYVNFDDWGLYNMYVSDQHFQTPFEVTLPVDQLWYKLVIGGHWTSNQFELNLFDENNNTAVHIDFRKPSEVKKGYPFQLTAKIHYRFFVFIQLLGNVNFISHYHNVKKIPGFAKFACSGDVEIDSVELCFGA